MIQIGKSLKILHAAKVILAGGVVAYPTEAVFGLGCDPFCVEAVSRLLALKKRSPQRGLILISHSWDALFPLLKPIPEAIFEKIKNVKTPCTWVLPATSAVPQWVCGEHASVAIRVTNHSVAKMLCAAVGFPIISTSANRAQAKPLRSALGVKLCFKNKIDYILSGKVGPLQKPTPILDPFQDTILRAGD